jgi:hypothetical protein
MAMEMDVLIKQAHRFVFETGDVSSCIVILEQFWHYKYDISHHMSIVAGNLDQLQENPIVRGYSADLLEQILSSPNCSLRKEDEIASFVHSFRYVDIEKWTRLNKMIRIERLSNKALVELLSDESMDLNEWRVELMHIVPQISFSPKKRKERVLKREPSKNLRGDESSTWTFGNMFWTEMVEVADGQLFYGIFARFRERFGRGRLTGETITVTPSSTSHGDVETLFRYNDVDYFGSNDAPNSYFVINLRRCRVSISGYSLKTHSHTGNGHIQGWTLFGSDDGEKWTEIDRRSRVAAMGAIGAQMHFRLPSSARFFQYFKFQQTQENTMGYNNLRLSMFEIFGMVVENSP